MQNKKKDTDEKEIAICNWNEKLGSSTCLELRATVLFKLKTLTDERILH